MRRVLKGQATNDLVHSAHVGPADRIFPAILRLYVKPGSIVADVTYGKGVFWKRVPQGTYDLRGTDIESGVDCRSLPYATGGVDCVVLDPPFMHSSGGTAHSSHKPFEGYYRNNETGGRTERKYHEAVLDLYRGAGREAYRVLRERGVLVVKCQDEICSNRQRFTHVEILRDYAGLGFIPEDIFIVMRRNKPGVSRAVRQIHARKNHSYFLVFWKRQDSKAIWEGP